MIRVPKLRAIASWTIMTVCLATAIVSAATIYRDRRDSARSAQAALKPLRIDRDVVSVGTLKPGQKARARFLLSNDGDRPLRIAGFSSGCVCTLPLDIPFTIPPDASRALVIEYTAPGSKPRPILAPVRLFTNSATQPEYELTIRGVIEIAFP